MFNRKIIIALALALSFGTVVFAESNDLLKMDIQKSSAQDTVDVTFYTTGGNSNSVVTRKSGNNYVVLLPNVSGNQSIVPNLGGVKDLVTDIKVKNVDDGIGGYTKVTFSTTKPIKIQTSTKKTAPLTKAQQDYKNLIVQNSKFDPDTKLKNFKSTQSSIQTPVSTPQTNTKTQTQNVQPVQSKKTAETLKKVQNTTKTIEQPKVEKQISKTTSPAVEVSKQNEVKVKPKTETLKQENKAVKQNVQNSVEPNVKKVEADVKKVETQKTPVNKENNPRKKSPLIPFAGLASVLGIFVIGGVINMVSRLSVKNSDKIKSIFDENSAPEENQNDTLSYQSIASDKKLNWQEKYKLYSQKEESEKPVNNDYSYVTDMSATMKAIISPNLNVKTNIPSLNGKVKKETPTDKEKAKIQAQISQMEHALIQTPSIKTIVKHKPEIHSEDYAISNSIKNIKLKSFSKNKKLEKTDRSLTDNPIERKQNSLKESRFIKLKDSALSMNHRASSLNITNLAKFNDNYPKISNRKDFGVKKYGNDVNDYQSVSVGEYLTILDSEEQHKEIERVTNAFENNNEMSNSPVLSSNPIKRTTEIPKTINGLKVKSGYNIDSEKGFYVVDVDGENKLIGRNNEEIFVLKNFGKNSNLNLQVRHDYDNVYIVKAGSYKSLVEVNEDTMGTLLEI